MGTSTMLTTAKLLLLTWRIKWRESDVTLGNNLKCDMPVTIPFPTTDLWEENFDINSPLGEHVVDFLMENEDIADLPIHLVKQLFSYLVKHPSSTQIMSDEPLELIKYMIESQEQFNINQEKFNMSIQAEISRLRDMLSLRDLNQDPFIDYYSERSDEEYMEIDSLTMGPLDTLLMGDEDSSTNPTKSYDVTFSNSLFHYNDYYTLCDNPLFDDEFEDISSLEPPESTPVIDESTPVIDELTLVIDEST
nr:hypothetical protein [Tanacetum cinerariifolium]